MIDLLKFPDLKGLVGYGHSLALQVGFYLNNCICMEKGRTYFEQDVRAARYHVAFASISQCMHACIHVTCCRRDSAATWLCARWGWGGVLAWCERCAQGWRTRRQLVRVQQR
jgi:hypothetical protein